MEQGIPAALIRTQLKMVWITLGSQCAEADLGACVKSSAHIAAA